MHSKLILRDWSGKILVAHNSALCQKKGRDFRHCCFTCHRKDPSKTSGQPGQRTLTCEPLQLQRIGMNMKWIVLHSLFLFIIDFDTFAILQYDFISENNISPAKWERERERASRANYEISHTWNERGYMFSCQWKRSKAPLIGWALQTLQRQPFLYSSLEEFDRCSDKEFCFNAIPNMFGLEKCRFFWCGSELSLIKQANEGVSKLRPA